MNIVHLLLHEHDLDVPRIWIVMTLSLIASSTSWNVIGMKLMRRWYQTCIKMIMQLVGLRKGRKFIASCNAHFFFLSFFLSMHWKYNWNGPQLRISCIMGYLRKRNEMIDVRGGANYFLISHIHTLNGVFKPFGALETHTIIGLVGGKSNWLIPF